MYHCIIVTFRDVHNHNHPLNLCLCSNRLGLFVLIFLPFAIESWLNFSDFRSRRNSWLKRAPNPSVFCPEEVKLQQRPGTPCATPRRRSRPVASHGTCARCKDVGSGCRLDLKVSVLVESWVTKITKTMMGHCKPISSYIIKPSSYDIIYIYYDGHCRPVRTRSIRMIKIKARSKNH